jgi:predicted Zn-dependent protease
MIRAALGWLAFAAAIAGVSQLQPRLAAKFHATKGQKEDVYVLPPPGQLKVMTLGYHSAAVDQIWAKTLVEFGTHAVERRDFMDAPLYLDAMIALEPDHAAIYKYADTLVVYRRAGPGTEEDARLARAYLKRGTVERPFDHEPWMHYGQFSAFLAATYLKDQAEIDQWRIEGAEAITRSVELGGHVDRGLGAAGILSKRGERDAAIRSLQRLYALTEDPRERDEIAARLQALQKTDTEDRVARDIKLVEGEWRRALPFLTRGEFLLVGPETQPARCAGPGAVDDATCARGWQGFLDARR